MPLNTSEHSRGLSPSHTMAKLKNPHLRPRTMKTLIASTRSFFRGANAKLPIVLGITIVLLATISTIALPSILYSQRIFDVYSITTGYLDEINQIQRAIDHLDLLERCYMVTGESRDLAPIESSRRRLNSSLERLNQRPYGPVYKSVLLPLLQTLSRNERSSNSNGFRELGPHSTLIVEQLHADSLTLSLLRERVPALLETVRFSLAGQLIQIRKREYYEILSTAILAASTVALILLLSMRLRTKRTPDGPPRLSNAAVAPSGTTHTPNSSSATEFDALTVAQAARADERATIARDVHDELGALLMAIKIDLKRSSKTTGGTRRVVDGQWPIMLDRVDAAMEAVTRIAGQLKPNSVQQFGLWRAIELYAKEFQEAIAIPCNLQFDIDDLPSLRDESAADIFRTFQESLTNVARHAQASMIEIKVRRNEGHLEIEIMDNGKGISPAQILDPGSLGVAGMFERARRLGGELKISRRPTVGTRVFFRMPLLALA